MCIHACHGSALTSIDNSFLYSNSKKPCVRHFQIVYSYHDALQTPQEEYTRGCQWQVETSFCKFFQLLQGCEEFCFDSEIGLESLISIQHNFCPIMPVVIWHIMEALMAIHFPEMNCTRPDKESIGRGDLEVDVQLEIQMTAEIERKSY